MSDWIESSERLISNDEQYEFGVLNEYFEFDFSRLSTRFRSKIVKTRIVSELISLDKSLVRFEEESPIFNYVPTIVRSVLISKHIPRISDVLRVIPFLSLDRESGDENYLFSKILKNYEVCEIEVFDQKIRNTELLLMAAQADPNYERSKFDIRQFFDTVWKERSPDLDLALETLLRYIYLGMAITNESFSTVFNRTLPIIGSSNLDPKRDFDSIIGNFLDGTYIIAQGRKKKEFPYRAFISQRYKYLERLVTLLSNDSWFNYRRNILDFLRFIFQFKDPMPNDYMFWIGTTLKEASGILDGDEQTRGFLFDLFISFRMLFGRYWSHNNPSEASSLLLRRLRIAEVEEIPSYGFIKFPSVTSFEWSKFERMYNAYPQSNT